MKSLALALTTLTLIATGCARNLEPPEIPVYHPANAHAVEAPRIEAFDVLVVTPALPPELPVTEGVQKPPSDPMMKPGMGGAKKDAPIKEKMDGEGAAVGKPPEHLHGQVRREGMREAMPEGTPGGPFPTDHAPAPDGLDRERLDDDIKRGEASMDDVKVPTEQRGMNADATLYHEHKHHDSTHIVHPDRYTSRVAIVGPHTWVCAMHPKIAVDTPGGRCPHCDAVLVPVKVDE